MLESSRKCNGKGILVQSVQSQTLYRLLDLEHQIPWIYKSRLSDEFGSCSLVASLRPIVVIRTSKREAYYWLSKSLLVHASLIGPSRLSPDSLRYLPSLPPLIPFVLFSSQPCFYSRCICSTPGYCLKSTWMSFDEIERFPYICVQPSPQYIFVKLISTSCLLSLVSFQSLILSVLKPS